MSKFKLLTQKILKVTSNEELLEVFMIQILNQNGLLKIILELDNQLI